MLETVKKYLRITGTAFDGEVNYYIKKKGFCIECYNDLSKNEGDK